MGCSSPSSKFDFMWYFLDGVLGDVELALDSFGDDAIEQVDEEVSENTESELHPPPGALRTLFEKNISINPLLPPYRNGFTNSGNESFAN